MCACVRVCIIGKTVFHTYKKEKDLRTLPTWWQSLCVHVAALSGILTLLQSMLKFLMNSLMKGFDHVEFLFILRPLLHFLFVRKGSSSPTQLV